MSLTLRNQQPHSLINRNGLLGYSISLESTAGITLMSCLESFIFLRFLKRDESPGKVFWNFVLEMEF